MDELKALATGDSAALTTRTFGPDPDNKHLYILMLVCGLLLVSTRSFGADIGGEDLSGNFETASSMLKTFDTILFGWLSPLTGAIFLFVSTWSLLQQKIVMFIIALIAAIFILIVPKFVKDLKNLNDGTIFSKIEYIIEDSRYV